MRDTRIWVDYNIFTTPLQTNKLNSITVDSDDIIWIGTVDKGLVKFDGKNWKVFNTSNSAITTNRILCVFADTENNKWVGTEGGGLAKISDDGIMTIINKSNSTLPNDHITAINQDINGNIWLGTYVSLSRLDNGVIQNFTSDNSNNPSGLIKEICPFSPSDI